MDLLPAIDILDGKAVRLSKGDYDKVTIYNEDPIDQAKKFKDAGAKWIHIVDLDGARCGTPKNIAIIKKIIATTGLNIEIGGGIRDIATIDQLVEIGAKRIVLGTILINNIELVKLALNRYPDIITAGIDAKDKHVAISGWEKQANKNADDFIGEIASIGIKHLVYTDISRDGMQTGIDVRRYQTIAQLFENPVIASGGVASLDDIKNLNKIAFAIEGVIVGRAIYEGSINLAQALEVCK